ncbi:hypothetical protein ACMD2_21302 [Ananas comosus]|uniref:AB hydrolase-1 domain-containing protein n=1 Tax=Ananas comosus TaxID=4615 RepID=A0A199UNN0_ANACO|nr:hypothetical protein ACMD2_21302 [Ananas comosus]
MRRCSPRRPFVFSAFVVVPLRFRSPCCLSRLIALRLLSPCCLSRPTSRLPSPVFSAFSRPVACPVRHPVRVVTSVVSAATFPPPHVLGCTARRGFFLRLEFLLVDLRCHGDSASIKKNGPNTVASAALDVLKLVVQLRVTPRVLVGHSFGGKVALSMVEQAAKPLARPVRVWILDATPGKVRAGGDGEDHPGQLIAFLSRLPNQVSSKQEIVDALIREGFSLDVARVC